MAQFQLPTNYDIKTYRETLGDFKGVDYSNSKINVAKNHSTDMRNFLYKDGNLHKRNGYEQVLQIPNKVLVGESYQTISNKINGMWQIKDVENDNIITIIHAGNKIYKCDSLTDISNSVVYELNIAENNFKDSLDLGEIEDKKSYGIIKNDKLYIFCGTLLVYGKFNNSWSLRYVIGDENTYIPITRTNLKTDGSFSVLDEVNLLNPYRKVRLIGESIKNIELDEKYNNNKIYEGLTDFYVTYNKGITVEIIDENFKKVFIGFKMLNDNTEKEELVGFDYYLKKQYVSYNKETIKLMSEKPLYDDFVDKLGSFYFEEKYENRLIKLTIIYGFKDKFSQDKTVTILSTENEFTYNLDSSKISSLIPIKVKNIDTNKEIPIKNENTELVNYNYSIDYNNSTITFYNMDLTPLIQGQPNIEVTFSTEEYINNKKWKWIGKCSFGEVLTYNDVETLFISGNPDLPNYDFHNSITFSEQQGELNVKENLTYFGELSYSKIGNKTNKITGYSLLEDGTLGIHKEYSNSESSFYVRSAEISNAVDLNGLPIYLQDNSTVAKTLIFPLISSAIGEGCISPYSIQNLVGDKLMASNNGIFGIELSSNIKTNERYAKQRSSLIDSQLIKEDLKNCSSIVYDGKYFLYVGGEENKVYVADSRYRNYTNNDLRDTFSYEWFVLENIEARIWFIDIDNNLYFCDNNGAVFKFKKDFFKDSKYNINYASIGEKNDSTGFYNYIEITENSIENNNKLYFNNNNFNEVLFTQDNIINIDNNVITVDENLFNNVIKYYFNQDIKYYIEENESNYIEGTLVETNKENSFKIKNKEGEFVDFSSTNITKIVKRIENAIAVVKKTKCYLQGKNYDTEKTLEENPYLYKVLDVSKEIKEDGLICYIKEERAVVSYFVTPILHLGALGYLKTINNILITSLSNNSSIDFGYNTVSNGANLKLVDGVKNIDYYNAWNNFDFYNTSFNMYEEFNTYNFRKKIKNFNTIQFYFLSGSPNDAVISNVILEYIINKRKK